jgi:hypothetical protein
LFQKYFIIIWLIYWSNPNQSILSYFSGFDLETCDMLILSIHCSSLWGSLCKRLIIHYITVNCFTVGFYSLAYCLVYSLKAVRIEFVCPCDEQSGGILTYPCSSVRPFVPLQFWSYSFNILHDVYTHHGSVHVHRILIFIKYLIMTGSWT